jgi:hypothetical protein
MFWSLPFIAVSIPYVFTVFWLRSYWSSLFLAFVKRFNKAIFKSDITVVISVCLSVRPHATAYTFVNSSIYADFG